MEWTIPGTTLVQPREDAGKVRKLFEPMFLAGGMVLSQVSNITGLEPYTIQNWVKRGFLAPPHGKRYNMRQVCRILNINLLRGALPLDQIVSLMGYINGSLTDESDDLIDDTMLYFMFVGLAARARTIGTDVAWNQELEELLNQYQEPIPGARERVLQVLRIMLTAWICTRLRQETEKLLCDLGIAKTNNKGEEK